MADIAWRSPPILIVFHILEPKVDGLLRHKMVGVTFESLIRSIYLIWSRLQ